MRKGEEGPPHGVIGTLRALQIDGLSWKILVASLLRSAEAETGIEPRGEDETPRGEGGGGELRTRYAVNARGQQPAGARCGLSAAPSTHDRLAEGKDTISRGTEF